MRSFKIIDTIISAALIFLFTRLFDTRQLYPDEFYMAYMITGAWQLLSMLVHFINKWFTRKGSTRNYYHRIVAYYLPSIWLAAILLHWLPNGENYFDTIWMDSINITASFMAVFYTALCFTELIKSKQIDESNSTR